MTREPRLSDIPNLNKKEPPPEGFSHPAYEVSGGGKNFSLSYLEEENWMMSTITFKSEVGALKYLLDRIYYGLK